MIFEIRWRLKTNVWRDGEGLGRREHHKCRDSSQKLEKCCNKAHIACFWAYWMECRY
jgi:hypothetical protein